MSVIVDEQAKARAAREGAAHEASVRLLLQHKAQMVATLKEKNALALRVAAAGA